MSASDFAPFSKVLKCGCIIQAEFPLHADGNVAITWCRLHAAAGDLRNALRWLSRYQDFWPLTPSADERIRQALAAVGDTA